MLKKFNQFILENYQGFKNKAEYIENLAKENDFAKNVIAEFTQNVDPTVRISNAVNTLDDHTQDVIIKMIEDEKIGKRDPNEVEANPIVSMNYNESEQIGGKNLFNCFMKIVSAVGKKSTDVNWESVPDHFLVLYITENIEPQLLQEVMNRYLYFDNFSKKNLNSPNNSKLYWGLKSDMTVVYGVITDKPLMMGSFALTQGTYNYILTLNLKSATNFKKFLVGLDLNKLSIYSKLKSVLLNYFPGQSDTKLKPTVNGDVISYSYQGLGNWDNGILDAGELDNIKSNLRNYLMQFGWSDQVQFNVNNSDSWVFMNLKIK
jgi:hypothetical protein